MPESLTTEELMHGFTAGWKAPHAHAWDDLLAPDVELCQPWLPDRRGRAALADEYGRLLALMPDLHGEVLDWRVEHDTVVVKMTLHATLGRRSLHLAVTDRLTLDDHGRIAARHAAFDPAPIVRALLTQPATWASWWHSGTAPLPARRRFTDHRAPSLKPRDVVDVLAVGRLVLAAGAWAAPDLAARLFGLDRSPTGERRYLLRVFAGRAAALGLGTLVTAGPARRRWQRLGLLVDISDTTAGLDPRLNARTHAVILPLTGTYAATGAAALARTPAEPR